MWVCYRAGTWDSVVTCFFIDTAHNIVEYIEIIWKILKDGGVRLNLVPIWYSVFFFPYSTCLIKLLPK